jgi:hypothetical protein
MLWLLPEKNIGENAMEPFDPKNSKGTLDLINPFGGTIHLPYANFDQMVELWRFYGSQGFIPADFPPGGWTLPYCMADTFDFAFIGGREFQVDDAHLLVWRGTVYKRRTKPAEKKDNKTIAARTWYSCDHRATVRSSDYQEKGTGDFYYIPIIEFKGGGRPIEWMLKKGANANRANTNGQAAKPATPTEDEIPF